MTHRLSVAHLTAITLPPPDFIHHAAEAGFDGVGLRLRRVTDDSPGYPLMDDPAALRATQAAMRATGLAVRDIEFVRLVPDLTIADLAPLLDAGAALGATRLICAPYDDDRARLADRLAELARLAAPCGIQPVLEFFPWTPVPDLASAWQLVQAAGRGVGLLVDSLHLDRSGWDLATLRAIPPERLPFAHLCDAPRLRSHSTQDLLHTARAERLPPGQGQIDLRAYLAALPAGIDLSVEVPMTALMATDGPAAVLRRVHRATMGLLARP